MKLLFYILFFIFFSCELPDNETEYSEGLVVFGNIELFEINNTAFGEIDTVRVSLSSSIDANLENANQLYINTADVSITGAFDSNNENLISTINLKDSSIYLKLVSTPFESKYLEEFVPAIKPININNPIVINMTIFNSLMNPITRGKATAKTLSVLDFNFTDVKSDFKLTPKEFNLDIKKAIFNDGQILGSISTEFSATNTTLSGTIFGSTINTAKTLPLKNNMTTGNFDIELAINGDNNELITSINCYSTTTSIANQKINTIETRLVSNELGNNFEKTKLYINNGLEPIYIESILTQNQQILIVDGSTIPFNDIISDPTNTIAELTTMSTLTIPIKNNAPQYNFNDIKTEFFISIESSLNVGQSLTSKS